MMVLYKKIVTAVVVFSFCVGGSFLPPAFAECFSTVWPHEKSDLQPDPSLIFGRLDNGFRYVLQKNTEPKNRVAMSLNIQAGSLNETDAQRGIAHFLEHMLFNGSTNFPPGKLIEYFQSIGMSFGGDTNAHTGYDETVYDILLPGGSKEDLEKGLLVFSDYARGALLLQTEIDRERGVVLAEKRSRDSAGYRAHVKEIAFAMQGTMVPERMPIGTLETLNKADHTLMKRFYDAWYRPDNMVLVIVGDFDPKGVQPLVEKQFAAMEGAGERPDCPELGVLQRSGAAFFYHHEEEMGLTESSVETLWNVTPEDDSRALEIRELTRYVANTIVQYRLDELSRKSDTPFTSAKIYAGTFLGRLGYAEIGAKSDAEQWQESLLLIENVLRQALEFGFTEDELQRVKKELLAELDSAVLTVKSRNSKTLNASIIRSVNSNRVLQSPQQEKAFLEQVLIQMSVADVEANFRSTWDHSSRHVKINGNALLGKTPLAQIKETYSQAAEKTVQPYTGETLQEFPYLHLENRHPVVSQEQFPDIDAKRFVFGNGVVLNLKATSFQENEVHIAADFGRGKSSEPQPGLALLSGAVIAQSGTASLSKSALDRIIAGSSVEMAFQIHSTSFSWQGKALNKDIELLFQVLQSLLADPGVDEDAFQVSMDRFRQYYDGLAVDVRGAMKLQGDSFLAGDNPFFGVPPSEEFFKLTSSQIREWMYPAVQNSGLEISLVGDFDEKEVLILAENYFSVLEQRVEKKEMRNVTVSFPKGMNLDMTIPSSIDKAMLVLAWKSDDFWDIQQTRGLHLLSGIFSDKMRRVIREKLGATYSPQIYNSSSRIYKDYGVIQAILIVDPSQIDSLKKEVLKIAADMWQGEISEEELARAKGPMLTSLKDMIRTNRYWLHSVLGLSKRYPAQLQWPLTILSGFENYSLEEIQKLGKMYLNPKEAAVITVAPQ